MFTACLRTLAVSLAIGLVIVATPTSASAAVTCGDTSQGANFGGGSGTSADAYVISDEAHLEFLRNATSTWSCAFKQVDDLNFGGRPDWGYGIGTSTTKFTGEYDGSGFKISNLTITAPTLTRVGIFGSVGGAAISAVDLKDITVSGDGLVGALAGRADSGTTISDVSISGSVQGEYYVGGLVGYSENLQVSRVITDVVVTSSGPASSLGSFGGLIGYMINSSASRSVTTGSISASGANARYVGGLAGQLTLSAQITDSYSTASVAGAAEVGGLAGLASSSTIQDAYAAGLVAGTSKVGGIVGDAPTGVTVTDSFWDTQTTGQTTSAGTLMRSSGVTTEEMHTFATFADAGWSIADGFSSSTTWGICGAVNGGYPFLTWRYSSDPCGGGASSSVAMAEFTFWLPEGRECSAMSPVRVPVGSMFELPGADAPCRTMPGAVVAGWTIPGPMGYTGYGSASLPFAPGLRVRVVDSQQFTVVPLEPVVSVMFDANVADPDECPTTEARSFDGVREDGRAAMVWVPRELMSMARFPSQAVCAPSGHELAGWSDGVSQYGLGDPMPGDWAQSGQNRRHLMAIWKPE